MTRPIIHRWSSFAKGRRLTMAERVCVLCGLTYAKWSTEGQPACPGTAFASAGRVVRL